MGDPLSHKVLTYLEYRAVSVVFQNIDPPPLPLASVSSPRTKGGGGTHSPGGGGGGVNILEDARHWIALLQYNPYTLSANGFKKPLSNIHAWLYLPSMNALWAT